MASKTLVGVLGGAAVGIAVGLSITGLFDWNGEDSNIVLTAPEGNGPCGVASKENVLIRRAGKKVKFWIRNHTCANASEVVTIGNFRRNEEPKPTTCDEPGTDWPFEGDSSLTKRRPDQSRKINLRLKDNADGTYYFEICTGTGQGQKVSDPRLVIDPGGM